jgi:hypothetical protein
VVRHHTLGNYGEADLSPVRSWVLDRVGHQPTSWARAFANFRELRKGEVRRIHYSAAQSIKIRVSSGIHGASFG